MSRRAGKNGDMREPIGPRVAVERLAELDERTADDAIEAEERALEMVEGADEGVHPTRTTPAELWRPGAGPGRVRKPIEERNPKASERARQILADAADEVALALVRKSLDGDPMAIKQFFDRLWGRIPVVAQIEERTERRIEFVVRRLDQPGPVEPVTPQLPPAGHAEAEYRELPE